VPNEDRVLVYSTDGSLPLPTKKPKKAQANNTRKAPPDDGVVRVGCERRRAGSMTTVYGLHETTIQQIAKDLKRRCGAGGSVKAGAVELQGDHRDEIVRYFAEQHIRAKRMGG
jgi:translation initiation factor 1